MLQALQTCDKDTGEAKHCLGMEIIRDSSDSATILKHEEYVDSVLTRFDMKDCKRAHTPMEIKLKMGRLPAGEKDPIIERLSSREID